MTWTPWRKIESPSNRAAPAVYKIRLARGGHPIKLRRFLKEDPHGLIVIGVSKNMENRRNDFLAGVKRGKGHSEGNLFYLIDKYAGLKKKLESFEVEYTFQPKNTRKAAAISEEMLIKHYAKRFGEVPPLNSVLPGRYRIPW